MLTYVDVCWRQIESQGQLAWSDLLAELQAIWSLVTAGCQGVIHAVSLMVDPQSLHDLLASLARYVS